MPLRGAETVSRRATAEHSSRENGRGKGPPRWEWVWRGSWRERGREVGKQSREAVELGSMGPCAGSVPGLVLVASAPGL